MKVTFLGATHEVTGSCTLISAGGHNIMIDCGMEQGADIFVNQELPVSPEDVDCLLLTHAHIDHSGKIPLLCKNGFTGSIYATEATTSLCNIMLLDSAHIQEQDAEWRNRKAARAGKPLIEPMYTIEDAQRSIRQFIPCKYGKKLPILENVEIRFNDIGHLLGSSAIEIFLTENGEEKKIVFSGDVGNIDQPIINDPQPIGEADYLVIESTYGDRLHPKREGDFAAKLAEHIQRALDRGGNVVIPSFAVGRTQELLYFLRRIKLEGMIKGHTGFPVYVDSPLANEATAIFMQCDRDYFDSDLKALLDKGVNPLYFDDLAVSMTADDSKAINFDTRPKVIIAASGMCEAGRIRHHLKHNLWKKENLILFVGYQATGTLGRALVEGTKEVKLFDETITVGAEIGIFDSISGHADKQGLLNWLCSFKSKPTTVFVNHGDDDAATAFTKCLTEEYGYKAIAPFSGTVFDLIKGEPETLTEGIRIQPRQQFSSRPQPSGREQGIPEKLIAAISALSDTARRMRGMENRSVQMFKDEVDALNDKWKRWLKS